MDGNLLSENCRGFDRFIENLSQASRLDIMKASLCRGFVIGAMDTLTMKKELCPPDGIDDEQAVDIVRLWLREHPEARHLSAVSLVQVALKEKFPCN